METADLNAISDQAAVGQTILGGRKAGWLMPVVVPVMVLLGVMERVAAVGVVTRMTSGAVSALRSGGSISPVAAFLETQPICSKAC